MSNKKDEPKGERAGDCAVRAKLSWEVPKLKLLDASDAESNINFGPEFLVHVS